jgi:hypothetical protein
MSRFERTSLRSALAVIALCASSSLYAQTAFKVGDREVHVHGSLQQGFNVTDDNNFLTMDTTKGSVEMTDAALNLMSSVTPKLRVGAQFYIRNIGDLGNGRLQIDWAFADYKFTNAFGVRGGKIKTVLGLFTDTQDMEFLYTWALLPQGTYPLDLRSVTIAHVGGDVYGTIPLGPAGSLAYTAFGGIVEDDRHGGFRYGLQDNGLSVVSDVSTRTGGFDTRWMTPVNGLMAGYSFMEARTTADLFVTAFGLPITSTTSPWRRFAAYADYQGPRVRVSGEFRRERRDTFMNPEVFPPTLGRSNSAFVAASYRLLEKLEVGSYYSHFVFDTALPASRADNHIYDKVVSARVDVNRFWHVKVEGHFIDGNGSSTLTHGFYLRNNRSGFSEKTNMLVIRTGVNF